MGLFLGIPVSTTKYPVPAETQTKYALAGNVSVAVSGKVSGGHYD